MRLRAVVRGRVQGVGFRWFVREEADALGLSGWVTNRADGTVELEAEGEAEDLERLKAALRKGPPSSRVEAVDLREVPAQGGAGFKVV